MAHLPRKTRLITATALLAVGCSDIAAPPEKLDALPRQLSVAERELISANNDFAFRLLRDVVTDPALGSGNVFLSPFSVSMVLGMTLNGAAGATYDSMRAVLGFELLEEAEVNASYRDLTHLLLSLDPRTELRIGNSVWTRQGRPFHESFFRRVRDYFGAQARELDFDAPGAKDVINAWVSDATNGRIEEIVTELRPEDIAVLVNAAYFNGRWRTPFDPAETALRSFYLEGEEDPVQVEMMYDDDMEAGFMSVPGVVGGAELPYWNSAYAMLVATPRGRRTLDQLVQELDAETWSSWLGHIRYEKAAVTIPKWEMAYEARLDDPLKRLGMDLAFSADADFTRLTAEGGRISRVPHKTFLKVDEAGTEAAAATAVFIFDGRGFIADEPFLVAIRERLSGALLFIGLVRDPR